MLLQYINQHTYLLNYPKNAINRIHACYENVEDIGGEQEARIL